MLTVLHNLAAMSLCVATEAMPQRKTSYLHLICLATLTRSFNWNGEQIEVNEVNLQA